MLGNEILRCEHFFTAGKVLHLFGALPLAVDVGVGGGKVGVALDEFEEAGTRHGVHSGVANFRAV